MSLKTRQLATGLLFLLLQGCSLAPAYLRPAMPVTDTFPAQQTQSVPSASDEEKSAAEIGWRDFFSDPAMQQLITAALANNRDLRQSALAVETYQAQYRIQRAALLPTVNANVSGGKLRTQSGENMVTVETYSATVGITAYELDFFGRVRNLKDNALEQFLAMEETQKSARLSLVAEVARAYLTLLADREILAITEETLHNEEKSYALVEQRANEGIATQLALAQSRTGLETARANLAIYRRQVGQDMNNLVMLVGGPMPNMDADTPALGTQQPFPGLPAAISSEVLLQRPDILAAEHILMGAHASIGSARAAFFPAISLTANAGVMSAELGDLFDGGFGIWTFSPSISLPIFTAGRLQAQLDVATLRKESSIAGYEKAIQNAFREVADALVAQDTYGDQLTAQQANLEANRDYYTIARNRYEQGLDNYLTMLDAQRSLYSARQQFVSTKLAQLVNQVNLYKALGGGWKDKS